MTLRLQGRTEQQKTITANEFLKFDIEFSDFTKLPIQTELIPILEGRLNEASRALSAKAYLSVVFMAGSVLEGVLLGSALARPREFNQAPISPKDKAGNVKQFQEWSLNDLIDVASHLGILKPDIKKFSHGLRDFRNYIHPNMQLISGFAPDEHTAKLCLQVLKAALASVAGTRK